MSAKPERPFVRLDKAPKLKRDYVGRRVISNRDFTTSQIAIPRGARGTIRYQSPGYRASTVIFDTCDHCGARPVVSSLHWPGDFDFIAEFNDEDMKEPEVRP